MQRAARVRDQVPDYRSLVHLRKRYTLSYRPEYVLSSVLSLEPQVERLEAASRFSRLEPSAESPEIEKRNPYRGRPLVAIVVSHEKAVETSSFETLIRYDCRIARRCADGSFLRFHLEEPCSAYDQSKTRGFANGNSSNHGAVCSPA